MSDFLQNGHFVSEFQDAKWKVCISRFFWRPKRFWQAEHSWSVCLKFSGNYWTKFIFCPKWRNGPLCGGQVDLLFTEYLHWFEPNLQCTKQNHIQILHPRNYEEIFPILSPCNIPIRLRPCNYENNVYISFHHSISYKPLKMLKNIKVILYSGLIPPSFAEESPYFDVSNNRTGTAIHFQRIILPIRSY